MALQQLPQLPRIADRDLPKLGDAYAQFANHGPDKSRPVTLVRPSVIFSASSYSVPICVPLGPAYLAAVLRKAKYEVDIVDGVGPAINDVRIAEDKRFKIQGMNDEAIIRHIDPESDIIGVSIMFSQEWPHVREMIFKIRDAFPSAKIVVGGEHVTAMPEYSLRDCPAIDFVVRGEGEIAFLELCYRLRSGHPIDGISGVVFLKDGRFHESPLSPRITTISDLPWPAWDLVDLEPYFQPNFTMGISYGRNMALLATRGCPYQCTFCSNPSMWTTRYVMRPVKDVVDEISYYVNKYGANSMDFYDLTAIVKKDWIINFIEELKHQSVRVNWQLPSGTRSESIDDEVVSGLAETGLKYLVYAPESGSNRILKLIKKRVNLKKMTESMAAAKKHGLVVKVNFIIGFPQEKRSDVARTILFAWRLALMKVDDCNISLFTPYPGSELFEELRAQNTIGKIDDEYFLGLMTQFDFTMAKAYCSHVGSFELSIYRFLGLAVYYVISYLRVPSRLFRLFRHFISRKINYQPTSLFEQRVLDFIVRKNAHR